MSRIILHIGTHKTATTSIQKFLFRHRDILKERGVFYPDYSIIGAEPHYAHLGMINGLSGQHKKLSPDLARQFFAEVRRRSADYDTTIISAEPMYRHVSGQFVDGHNFAPEDYWLLRRTYVEKIAETFGDAEIVVVFRQQKSFAQSMYQEHVKATRYKKGFTAFLNEKWYLFDYLGQVNCWKTVFPKFTALGFAGLQQEQDVSHAFCRQLGMDLSDLDVPPRKNEGLPVDLVVFKRAINHSSGSVQEIREKMEMLKASIPDTFWKKMKHRSFFNSITAERRFQAQFKEDNAVLSKMLVGPLAIPDKTPYALKKGLFGDRLHPAFLCELMKYIDISGNQ